MKKHRFLAALLVCLMVSFTFLPVTVSAAGTIDLNETASLTLTERFNDTGLSGVTFDLYLVSTVDETGELTPVEAFKQFAADLDIRGKNDESWQSMAKTLEQELISGNLGDISPADSAVTDDAGTARFPTQDKVLTMGLYLVPGTRSQQGTHVYSTSPFFVLIPEQNPETNTWHYAASVTAKASESPLLMDYSVVKVWEDDCHRSQRPKSITIDLIQDGKPYGESVTLPYKGEWKYTWENLDTNHIWSIQERSVSGYKEPVIRQEGNTFIITNTCSKPASPSSSPSPANPSNPSSPTLPNTGQLWWPIPLLIAVGLLFVIIGLIRRRGAGSER